jgi:hypothetical protein
MYMVREMIELIRKDTGARSIHGCARMVRAHATLDREALGSTARAAVSEQSQPLTQTVGALSRARTLCCDTALFLSFVGMGCCPWNIYTAC